MTRIGAGLTALAVAGSWTLFSADPAAADQISAGEWGRGFIHAAQANEVTNGTGVTVGLLDSGVMPQRVNLIGQVTTGPDYAGGVEQPGQPGWGEHGTCMASIIAGTGAGQANMLGVAPGAHILSIRVIRDDDAPDVGQPETSSTPISDGIHYAVDHGVQVISMSIGGDADGTDGDASDEADAIRYALDHNVAVVIAAGNTGTDGNAISFPGADRGAITVAAVDQAGNVANFSTTSWDVDVAAPGANITCDAADTDDEMEVGDGTSQATAFTAGVVALIKAENKNLSPAQIRDILEQTAQDKPAGGRNDQIGFGIINAQAALALAAKTKATPENPATGVEVPTGYFGYGPTEVVAEAAPSFGALQRAVSGGAVLLLGACILAFALIRRARRDMAMAAAAASAGSAPIPGAMYGDATVVGVAYVDSALVDPAAATAVLPNGPGFPGGPGAPGGVPGAPGQAAAGPAAPAQWTLNAALGQPPQSAQAPYPNQPPPSTPATPPVPPGTTLDE